MTNHSRADMPITIAGKVTYSHRHVGETRRRRCIDERETSRTLPSGSLLEPGHQLSGHPPAVFDSDALRLWPTRGPRCYLPRPRALRPAQPAARPASRPPRRGHIARQRIPQRLSVPGVGVL